MLYIAIAICVTLLLWVLIGKPIRIEIIHTYTPQPLPPEVVLKAEETVRAAQEALGAMAYVNKTFHNVEEGEPND